MRAVQRLALKCLQWLLAAGLCGPLVAQATMVRLSTSLGPVDVQLYDSTAPISVNNFLAYVQGAAYDDTFIHRSVPGFVVQGGGYTWGGGSRPHITTRAPIALEYSASRPNVRGSLAMARTSDLNSATSEWFVNLVDNTTTLGPGNGGGYAVFGQVTAPGLAVIDAIAALRTGNAGGAFTTLPLLTFPPDGVLREANLVKLSSARVLPAPSGDADRAFNYLEAVYFSYLKPPGAASATGDANGKRYYFRYYAASNSYVGIGVDDNVIYYLVPAVSSNIERFAPLADLLPTVSQAGY